MGIQTMARCGSLAAAVGGVFLISAAAAQDGRSGRQPAARSDGGYHQAASQPGRPQTQRAAQPQPQQQPQRVAQHSAPAQPESRPDITARQPNEHPLMPALRWAYSGLRDLEAIQDYSAVMVKRERINGELKDPQYIYTKIRHRPLSVYMLFLKPENLAGREVIWVEGQNDGKLVGHGTGIEEMFGTLSLDPAGPIAMRGQRYPITEVGILNMVRRLIEIGENDTQYGECEVTFFQGAKINGRSCTCIQAVHPRPRREFLFHVARIFVDDELNLPIRYEAYDWPSRPGGPPELTEEYTYLDLKVNNGFTDADFDVNNPNYGFSKK